MLGDLYTETKGELQGLRKSVAANDIGNVRALAHTIKGASANMMCYPLRDRAAVLEKHAAAAMKGDIEAKELVKLLSEGLDKLEDIFQEYESFLDAKGLLPS
ncbi:unnamed protein product [Chrysoparadoxa australica]